MPDSQPNLQEACVPSALMTIFGATGDLTKRLLLPSIYNLAAGKVLPDSFQLLGAAMDDWNDDRFRQHMEDTLKEFWGPDVDQNIVGWLTQRASYQKVNFDQPESFIALKTRVEQIEKDKQTGGNRLFYLAIAPSFIAIVAEQLGQVSLLNEDGGCFRRLIIEKPFGHDLASAKELNQRLQKSLREDQIYRIDHFAGKDAVQDLAVFRFSNAIIEPLWNRSLVDYVQITVAETVGVEQRSAYYEKSGALRDMVPNHMAELLSLVAMEPPVSFNAIHMRDKQVELLDSIRKPKPEEVANCSVRGQYGAGKIDGQDVPAYRNEPGVDPNSNTDTFIAMRVEIDNWRWSGVPFYLRTGKRMERALTEIVVTFRQPPARLFPNSRFSDKSSNELVFNLKPYEQIHLSFGAKAPGLKTVVARENMDFQFPAGPFGNHGKGYERLLHDVLMGNSTLFQSAEFVEAGWGMVQPILDAWEQPPTDGFPNYAAGSAGPKSSDHLLTFDNHSWRGLDEAST